MKKIITTLATLGVLTSASLPIMANAATTTASHAPASSVIQVHHQGLYDNPNAPKTLNTATTTSAVSSYQVSITPNSTTAWGSSTLTADDARLQFHWQVTPADSRSYSYSLAINCYTNDAYHSYLGSINCYGSGTGTQDGYADYPWLEMGSYSAILTGTWTATDGSSGNIPSAKAFFSVGI